MTSTLAFIIMGYMAGSILFARAAARLMNKPDILSESPDGNPGTANAFKYGGFLCGMLTLTGDVLKGILPVWFYFHYYRTTDSVLLNALVMAAPVIGHVYPLLHKGKGGKGIAVTFGCLAGLLPVWAPLLILVGFFIMFSTILCITPHFSRTIVTYLSTSIAFCLTNLDKAVIGGFLIITLTVISRMRKSKEERAKTRIKLLWTH